MHFWRLARISYGMKKVLIIGCKKSGIAAARLLAKRGYAPCIFDDKLATGAPMPDGAVRITREEVHSAINDFDFAVLSPGVSAENPVVKLLQDGGVGMISELELGAKYLKAPAVAVTGTNGKTTTVSLITSALIAGGIRAVACGNIGTPVSDVVDGLTERDLAVVEVSSFQLERTTNFHPRVAVVTNVGRDHLDRHSTFKAYADLKFSIMKNLTKADLAVLNHDDEATQERADEIKARIVWVSKKERLNNGVYLVNGEVFHTLNGAEKKVCSTDGLKLKFPIENFLCALAVCLALGVKAEDFISAAKAFVPEENTMTPVAEIGKVKFFNDSKGTNPDATTFAVENIDGKCVLIAGGRNKGNDFSAMARDTKAKLRAVVALGECSMDIADAYKAAGFRDVVRVKSLAEAVRLAYEMAYPGDSVLFSPASASFDSYANYKERGRKFVDAVRQMK